MQSTGQKLLVLTVFDPTPPCKRFSHPLKVRAPRLRTTGVQSGGGTYRCF